MSDIFPKLGVDPSDVEKNARWLRNGYDRYLRREAPSTDGEYMRLWKRFQNELEGLNTALENLDSILDELRKPGIGMHVAANLSAKYPLDEDPFEALAYGCRELLEKDLRSTAPRQKDKPAVVGRRWFVFQVMREFEVLTKRRATINRWPDAQDDIESKDFEQFLLAYAEAALLSPLADDMVKDVLYWRRIFDKAKTHRPS